MVARGWFFPFLTILVVVHTTSSQSVSLTQPAVVQSGNVAQVSDSTDGPVPLSSTSLPVSSNSSSAPPVTGSTEEAKTEDPEEKTVTEQIRTYIEDSVKSVKSAISKIGKFVGEFFDQDAASNSTMPANASVSATSTSIPPSVAASSTLPPSTAAPQ